MVRVKNLQAGILIVADARLKLGPGEVRDVEVLTPQMESAVDAGLLARVDPAPETKQRGRSAGRSDQKAPVPTTAAIVTATPVPCADSGDDGDAL